MATKKTAAKKAVPKKVAPVAQTEATEAAQTAPKAVYAYTVTRLDNGLYDVQGLEVESGKGPSIDQIHAYRDIVDFGNRLHDELIINEAVSRTVKLLQDAQAQADATKSA